MTDPRLSKLTKVLRDAFPRSAVEVRPFEDEEDEAIQYFVYVLDVPSEQLREVTMKAWDLALELFADSGVFFHLKAVSKETTARYFPKAALPSRPTWTAKQLAGYTFFHSSLMKSLVATSAREIVVWPEPVRVSLSCVDLAALEQLPAMNTIANCWLPISAATLPAEVFIRYHTSTQLTVKHVLTARDRERDLAA